MIDFTKELHGVDGPLVDELAKRPQLPAGTDIQWAPPVLTLGMAAFHALVANYSDEPGLSGEEKFLRAELAVRIKDDKDAALTEEERQLIKELIAKLYAPLVVYRAWLMLTAVRDPANGNGREEVPCPPRTPQTSPGAKRKQQPERRRAG